VCVCVCGRGDGDDDDDDDDEWEDTDEEGGFGSEGGLSGNAAREFMFMDEETKTRFTEYSMTSSVMRRNEQLTLLDDRFEKVNLTDCNNCLSHCTIYIYNIIYMYIYIYNIMYYI